MVWTLLAACTLFSQRVPEECGDGIWAPFEVCDPADPTYGPQCKDDCTWHLCGDGVVAGVETCDPPGPDCSSTCQPVQCGDGEVSDAPCWRLETLSVGGVALAPRFGDVDLDGDLDIVTPTAGSTAVAVLVNDNGSFGRITTVEVGIEAAHVLVHPDGHLFAIGPTGFVVAVFDGSEHTLDVASDPTPLVGLDADFPPQLAHGGQGSVLLTRADVLLRATWALGGFSRVERYDTTLFDGPITQGFLHGTTTVPLDPADGLSADSGTPPIGPWTTPGAPDRIRLSPWRVDAEPTLEWTTGGELHHVTQDFRPVSVTPIGDAHDAILFARTPDRPLQLAAIDDTGLFLTDGTDRQTVLERSRLDGLDFADANGDLHLDLLTRDAASGDVLLILGDP